MADPLKVLVTGAAGQISYSLLYSLAKGDVFGAEQPIILHLLDIEFMMNGLNGVVMELQDCALPLLKSVVATCNVEEAFADIDVALLVGAMPRREGMERKDLLKANVKIFKQQGEALDKFAKKSVLVLVVGNPANTNAYICKKYAPSISPNNFSCLTRLDQNRAQSQIAMRLGVSAQDVKDVTIWGNHSSTQFPDVAHATVNIGGTTQKVVDAIKDDHYLKTDFIKTVQTRGAAVIALRKLSSAMSAAKAICDHMRDWYHGTGDSWVSMGVSSNGEYGIEKGLLYSYPVRIVNKQWKVVDGLSIDEFAREKMSATQDELIKEKNDALEECSD